MQNVRAVIGDTDKRGGQLPKLVKHENAKRSKPYSVLKGSLNGKGFEFEVPGEHVLPLNVAQFLKGQGYISGDWVPVDANAEKPEPKKRMSAAEKARKALAARGVAADEIEAMSDEEAKAAAADLS